MNGKLNSTTSSKGDKREKDLDCNLTIQSVYNLDIVTINKEK